MPRPCMQYRGVLHGLAFGANDKFIVLLINLFNPNYFGHIYSFPVLALDGAFTPRPGLQGDLTSTIGQR
jgi:hypothetical protein